jgi:serine/threonine protein kinase
MHHVVSCPIDDVVLTFVDGTLAPARVDEVKQHILGCEACRELIAEVAKAQFRGDHLPAGASVGRYEIRRVVGSGGMGVVYEAHDPTLNRRVALKVIKSRVTDERGDQHLLREAEAQAQLQHPNVVAVYDVGTFDDQIFVAMELVDGVTLSTWMTQPRSIAEILDAFAQAGRGLVAAHAADLVHRDFKPDNVLVDHEGRARVGDFGLAQWAPAGLEAPSPAGSDILGTATGALVGTPAYMAPEQLIGGTVDARTDQFSFCVALYEAIYGRRPFGGTSVASLTSEVLESPRVAPPRRGVPVHLRRSIVRGLSVAQSDRFSTLAELLTHLSARPRILRRIALVALPLVAIVCTATLLYLHSQQPPSSGEDMAPENAEAAAAYADGLAAISAHDWARARNRFTRAVELAPDHALSHASLAETWKELGYDDKAEAEAKLALASAAPSSREGQLLVQGRCAVAQAQESEAAKAFAALFAFRPDDIEYGLELAEAELNDGHFKEADAVVARLRHLPGAAGSDLRIGLLDATVKVALGELETSRTISAGVVEKARARHDEELTMEAHYAEAFALFHLGHTKEAMAIADDLARNAPAGLPVDQALVEALLGNIYLAQDQLDEAERHFREDLRISRALGSRDEVSQILQNLGNIAAARGDDAGQVAVLEDQIPLLREHGPQRSLATALSSLTDSLTRLGALQKAIAPCEESRDIARAMHDRMTDGYANLDCSKLHLALGELDEAKRRMDDAVASAREGGDNDLLISVLLWACTLDQTRGEFAEAHKVLDEARSISATTGQNSMYVEQYTAQLEIDEGKLAQAEKRLQSMMDGKQPQFETAALAFLAKAELKRKQYTQALDAMDRAWKDPSVANDTNRRIQLLGQTAYAYAATGSPKLGGVIAQLEETAARAKDEGNIDALLEVRVFLAEADRLRDPAKGRRELSALALEAEHRGFVLIAKSARAAMH